jgi:transcriptional regulator GlxA family with amidase domain
VNWVKTLNGGEFLAELSTNDDAVGVFRRSEQGEQLERMAQSDGHARGVAKAVIWLKVNFDKPFSIKLIAKQTNMSPSGLHHHFKTLTNMTPFNIKNTFACRRLDGSCCAIWSGCKCVLLGTSRS